MTFTDTRIDTDDTATTAADGRATTDWVALARDIGSSLAPGASSRDHEGAISRPAFEQFRERGVLTALVPRDRGGGGASHAQLGAFLRELGRHDGPTAVALSMHSHLVATQVWRHRHGADADAFFARLVGERPVLVSTGASDWVSSSGTARRVEGGYRVDARKAPASGCEVGDLLVTSIRWDDGPDGAVVLHFAVPFAADGIDIDPTWDTLGMRATGSHTVVLDDVFVPDTAVSLVRPADAWHPFWNAVVGAAMPLIMSAYVGIADAATDLALADASGRTEPHVLQLVGEMANAHTTAADVVDAMLDSSDDLAFEGTDRHSARTLARKTVATDALIESVRLAVEATGGRGYTRGSDLERLYRDVHGALFHPLPAAKQARFTGRALLGMEPTG